MASPEPPQFVISGAHQLDDAGKRIFDNLIAWMLLYNDPGRPNFKLTIGGFRPMPEIDGAIRDNFWKRVFAGGWATDKPNILEPRSNMKGELPRRMVKHANVGELSDTIEYDETKSTYQSTDILVAAKPDVQNDLVDFAYSYQSGSVFSACKKRPVFKKDSMNQPSQVLKDKAEAIRLWDEAQMEWLGEWNYERAIFAARRHLVDLAGYYGGDDNGVLCCGERHPMESLAGIQDEETRLFILIQSSREILKRTRLRLLDKIASFRGEKGEDETGGTRRIAYGFTNESKESDENSEELTSQLQCIKELADTTELLVEVVKCPPPNIW
ncbi:hypothetical protein HER10_EVM0010078 [Colletotrichum scovillei]|uniref:Uncharacterized protein n=1 Tax=Colletotrichum scovillei TaxID=1209932 RepID=A0A9P7QWM9_9PEZI|nr:uncharacterized protein HER10_EVM0010078 [Colletotrichum scovillei]KAF4778761.1 hypothetical protein HER10_EVM0010078 [Colletotrichum scovillei]KAG7044009.1 hypothetical protein JMJ77_0011828 [Colletotrichum scovillei]KAG7046113.1 hypothetical protein JMJ78_0011181 [Colletotrichum scovillei]KAG7063458.1 hypothetical protein JMJ76_0005923 [Colletotrichum scovillei]